jgi:hypothetical protein
MKTAILAYTPNWEALLYKYGQGTGLLGARPLSAPFAVTANLTSVNMNHHYRAIDEKSNLNALSGSPSSSQNDEIFDPAIARPGRADKGPVFPFPLQQFIINRLFHIQGGNSLD